MRGICVPTPTASYVTAQSAKEPQPQRPCNVGKPAIVAYHNEVVADFHCRCDAIRQMAEEAEPFCRGAEKMSFEDLLTSVVSP